VHRAKLARLDRPKTQIEDTPQESLLILFRKLTNFSLPLNQTGVGHFLYLNMMKVHDVPAYIEFEDKTWRPMAEEWVKQGAMSGWIFATKVLPGGTDTTYSAYSADMFPTWEAAFAVRPPQPVFEKVHPGKKYDQLSAELAKLRNLGRRELWEIVERVEKKK